jgi:hypothetical protein
MKVFSKLFMLTLVLSVFAGCSKDDDNLPLEGVAGKYGGTITVTGVSPVTGQPIEPMQNVEINIVYNAATKKATLSLNLVIADILGETPIPISAPCTVTSTKDSYSLSGNAEIDLIVLSVSVVVNSSSAIDKSGKAVIDMLATATVGGNAIPLPIKFEGQKK